MTATRSVRTELLEASGLLLKKFRKFINDIKWTRCIELWCTIILYLLYRPCTPCTPLLIVQAMYSMYSFTYCTGHVLHSMYSMYSFTYCTGHVLHSMYSMYSFTYCTGHVLHSMYSTSKGLSGNHFFHVFSTGPL